MGKKQNLFNTSLYHEMWDWALTFLAAQKLTKREISNYFDNYSLKLPLLFRLVFRCSKIGIRLCSFESRRVAVATISQMEKPAGSAYFCDTAFFIRPSADLRAPVLHSDALDPMAGVKGMFEIDLFNINRVEVDIDKFLGNNIDKINKALKIAEPYQIAPAHGRGKYSAHVDSYKCKYRIELHQPDAGDAVALQKFFQAELAVFKLFTEAYLTSISTLLPEKSIVENNKKGFDTFINILLKKDFAAKMGKKIFKGEFQKYFHEGCWRTGYYGISSQPE
jgi:hypothetical protein